MSTDNKIAEFRESFAFKSGQSFERRRLERLIENRRSELQLLEGPSLLTRNARIAAKELTRVIEILRDMD
jgi:hypothetical protein